ncbi:MAG: aminoacetone oxidase family FAD-binding enzyme [Clostridia bacterium]|nr:aminoacetone oxidase family FAD-binding enzyme [Clostridia bacterium]
MNYDIIIVGGGAAGLACAARLNKSGKNLKICLIDAGDRLGKKLAATGNGQGNVSNEEMTAEHFHGGNINLAEKIACADPYAGAALFGCLFTADEKGRIYPAGKQASALVDDLSNSLKNPPLALIAIGRKVEKINKTAQGFEIPFGDGAVYKSKFLVLCTGGMAQKQFKTDGSAYPLATAFGHTLTPLFPSLVQLKTETTHIKTLKGIRADCAVTAIYNGKPIKKVRGDVIFTDYGVSGNAIFYISSYVADKHGATLSLEFLPDFSSEDIEKSVFVRKNAGYETSELLSGTLHNQIGRAIIKRAGTVNSQKIVQTLKNFTLSVSGTLGFDYAQVTKGGINMNEITEKLESKLVKNLFFAGEILDVDGDCGGYNLQWAFTSGMAVADEILKRI